MVDPFNFKFPISKLDCSPSRLDIAVEDVYRDF